jgi:hypothetical protein
LMTESIVGTWLFTVDLQRDISPDFPRRGDERNTVTYF